MHNQAKVNCQNSTYAKFGQLIKSTRILATKLQHVPNFKNVFCLSEETTVVHSRYYIAAIQDVSVVSQRSPMTYSGDQLLP